MESQIAHKFHENLTQKKRGLDSWLGSAQPEVRELRLAHAGELDVQEHIHVVEQAIQHSSEHILGRCRVCGESVEAELLEMDFTAEVCLTHFSPQELRELEYELELSRLVQKSLLPQAAPQVPGLEVAAYLRPAQIVGGDFFDFQLFRDGRQGIVIADVAGKGVSASLVMASIQTALRTLIPGSDSPLQVINSVNRLFSHNIHLTTFVTLFLGAYNPAERTLSYCNAGHNPPLVQRNQGTASERLLQLLPNGPAIGLVENPEFQECDLRLHTGDLLLFYTDGVSEAVNQHGEQYGMQRLGNFLCDHADQHPRDVLRYLQHDMQVHIQDTPVYDDVTMIACRVNGM